MPFILPQKRVELQLLITAQLLTTNFLTEPLNFCQHLVIQQIQTFIKQTSLFRGNKAFEGLSQNQPHPNNSEYLPPFCVPTGLCVPRGGNPFSTRRRRTSAPRIFGIIPLYHFFDQFVNRQTAQSFSRNFVHFAY